MANVLNKTTGQFLRSVNEPDYPQADWIWSPDISAFDSIGGYQAKYAVLPATNPVQMMDLTARNAVDAALAAAAVLADKAEQKNRIDQEKAIKAIALVMLDMYDLIKNELKGAALNNPLPTITAAQMRQRFLDKVDSL